MREPYVPGVGNLERTGWRDAAISAQHRRWGVQCHACDLDFPLVEHCYGVVAALVEYKHLGVDEQHFNSANHEALRWLADNSNIPFVICVYDPLTWGVRVYPNNVRAQAELDWGQEMTEREWVGWLHRARGVMVERRTRDGLKDELPRARLRKAG